VEKCEPAAIFVRPGSKRTIGLHDALNFTTERNPSLFTPAEVALLLQAKDLRNAIEHYQIDFKEEILRSLCVDYLAICVLSAQTLLSINIAEAFSWNHFVDQPDEVANYLGAVLGQMSDIGRGSTRRAGDSWASENASEPVFLCLNCGAKAVSRDRGFCMGCGSEGDEEIVALFRRQIGGSISSRVIFNS
jgi:hypothetical protein